MILVNTYINKLRNLRRLRTELEEEIELWKDQIALTSHQIKLDAYNNTKPSKDTKRRNRNAQSKLRECEFVLNRLRNEIISYTAKRLNLTDLQEP